MHIEFTDGWVLASDEHNWMLTSPPPSGLTPKGREKEGKTTFHKDLEQVARKLLNEKAKYAHDLGHIAFIFTREASCVAAILKAMQELNYNHRKTN